MAIKNLVCRGIGFTGGFIKWVVTRGLDIGSLTPGVPGNPVRITASDEILNLAIGYDQQLVSILGSDQLLTQAVGSDE